MNTSLVRFPFIFCLCCLLLTSCSTVRVVETEADEGFHLSNYKTFDFYEVEVDGDSSKSYASQLNYLKREISQQMEQQGLQRSSTAPDLKINLGIVIDEKVQTRQTNINTDPPYYMGQRRYTWKSREVEVGRYQKGALSMHLVDNSRSALVWQGVAEGVLPDNTSKLQKRISEGVRKLIEEIPR